MSAARRAGVGKIGFVTQPEANGSPASSAAPSMPGQPSAAGDRTEPAR
jgi:hypothetical protein